MISNTSITPGRFCYYPFCAANAATMLLPKGRELVVDQDTGYCMVLAFDRLNNQIITASQFSTEELPALLLLCSYWPSMVTYELLVTALHPAPKVPIVGYEIEDARNNNSLDQLLAPLKQQIESYRQRLQELGLDVREIDGYGYRLIPAPTGK